MKKLMFMIFGVGLVFASCDKEDSSDVNQDKIYCDYELFYNQNDDKTHAVARFRFGGPTGTLLELTDSTGASVKYNGETLPYDVWYGGHHKEYAGQIEGGTFVYTNTNGDVYSNAVPAGEAIGFQPDFDTIVKTSAQTLTWVGTGLSTDQHVGVFVGSWTWGEDAAFATAAHGATNIIMGVTQMAGLAAGPSTVYMDRSTARDIAEGPSEGGRIRYKFRATNASVTVIE